MILIRILSKSEKKIERIAGLLIKERLGIDLNIKRNIERPELNDNELIYTKVHLLTAKTKALLFPRIDSVLRELYSDEMPEIYSIPIVHMDWEQSEQLIADVVGI